jgi:hypothetical protein
MPCFPSYKNLINLRLVIIGVYIKPNNEESAYDLLYIYKQIKEMSPRQSMYMRK